MISRRHFLGASTAGAASLTLTGCEAGDQSSEGLPPSIARLESLADLASPITRDERARRVEKAKEMMTLQGLDGIALCGGTSMVYFTNVRWGGGERLFSVLIPRQGEAFVVCPAFEEDRAREQLALGPLDGSQVYTWEEHQNPYERVAQGFADRGLRTGKVGAEETMQFRFSNGIAVAAPAIDVVDATGVTGGCRGVKDVHELELMKLANEVTLTAYKAAYLAMEEGMTQGDVGDLIRLAHQSLGFSGSASVQTGEWSALPHGSITPQVIREGTIVLIDGGCSVEGYRSDMSRTFVLGEPTDIMRERFDIELNAQTAAYNAAGPGVLPEDVDSAARQVIETAGYGPGYTYFTHRVGHGIGMDGHEWPYLVKGNRTPLIQGNVFSDEPGIYVPGEFGVRLEDCMYISETGAELFTPQSPSLDDPFGNWDR